MQKLTNDLITNKYTTVFHEDSEDMKYGAPHTFEIYESKDAGYEEHDNIVCRVDFQCGPIKECGVNGVMNEDLLAMVLTRLEHFQRTQFSCRENALAITKIEEALMWLRKRTTARERRGVEGTHTK